MGDVENGAFTERENEEFYFKQLKNLQVFDASDNLPLGRSYLLAVSNRYGLCFAGCPVGFKIIKTSVFGEVDRESGERSANAIVTQYPSMYIDIGHLVCHIAISSDDVTLSVCYEHGDRLVLRVYDIPTLALQGSLQGMLGEVVLMSSPGISLVNLLWNPTVSGMFAVCYSNGMVAMWEMNETQIKQVSSLPVSTRATAICWSPKGKQIVVGHKDGHMTQYSPNLQDVKKETPSPEVFRKSPHQVTSICWVSSTVFVNVYTSPDEGEAPKCIVICNQSKTTPKKVINFEDVYFGMSNERENGFYMAHVNEWNVTLTASCNAFEVAVLGNEGTDWEKWQFSDENRAEMPLTSDKEETFPMGMTIDFTSTLTIQENEKTLPPAPVLLLLSTKGVLCPFYMINKSPSARHDIVKPAQALPHPGSRPKIAAVNAQSQGGAAALSSPATKPEAKPGFSLKPSSSSVSQTPTLTSTEQKGDFSLGSGTSSGITQPTTQLFKLPSSASPLVTSSGATASTRPLFPASMPTSNVTVSQSGKSLFSFPLTMASDSKPANQGLFKLTPTTQIVTQQPLTQQQPPQQLQQLQQPPQQLQLQRQQQQLVREQEQQKLLEQQAELKQQQSLEKLLEQEQQKQKDKHLVKPTLPSSQDNLELSMSTCIHEEILHFNKELASLGEDVQQVKQLCSATLNPESLENLRKQTNEKSRMNNGLKQTTKEHNKEIQDIKLKLLSSFEILEDARVRNDRAKDPRYHHLLKSRNLDPVNANKMRNIRELYMHLDKTLREVNLVLDEEWNKENETKSKIQRPSLDVIYRTLRLHHMVSQEQSTKIERLVEKMKQKRLLSPHWSKPSPTSKTKGGSDLSNLEESLKKVDLSSTVKSPIKVQDPIPVNKTVQLTNMLRKRQTTPIRKSTIVVPSTLPSKQLLKRLGASKVTTSPPFDEENIDLSGDNDFKKQLFSSTPGAKSESLFTFKQPKAPVSHQVAKQTEQIPEGVDSTPARLFSQNQPGAKPESLFTFKQNQETVSDQVVKQPEQPPEGVDSTPARLFSQNQASSAIRRAQTGLSTRDSVQESKAMTDVVQPVSKPTASGGTASTAFKAPSSTPAIKEVSVPVQNVSPVKAAAQAAMIRAEKSTLKNPNLDPAASIEPSSMVLHGRSHTEKERDIETETSMAREVAEAAVKASQLQAQKSVSKPQSSTEFSFKNTDVAKLSPGVSANRLPAPNVTVKPLPVTSVSFTKSSVSCAGSILSQFPTSATVKSTTGNSRNTKDNIASSTAGVSSSLLYTGSNLQQVTTAASTVIEKPDVIPSPGVSRRLFGGTTQEGTMSPSKGNVATTTQADLKPFTEKSSSTGLFALQTTTASKPVSTEAGKQNAQVSSSSGFKFSYPIISSMTAGISGASMDGELSKKDNVVKPFASQPFSLGTTSSSTPQSKQFSSPFLFANKTTGASTASISTITTTNTSSSTSTTESTSSTLFSFGGVPSKPSSTFSLSEVVSGSGTTQGSTGLVLSTAQSTGGFLTAPATSKVNTTQSRPSFAPQSGLFQTPAPTEVPTSLATESTATKLSSTKQSGLFGTPSSISTSTPQAGLLGGPTSITSTTQGGLFGGPTSNSTSTSQGGLFGAPTSTSTSTSQGGLFGGPTSISSNTSQGGLFGGPTSTITSTTQGGLFGGPTSISTNTSQGGLFVAPTSISTNTSQGGLFGTPTSTITSTSQGGIFALPKSTSNEVAPFGSSAFIPSQGGPFRSHVTTSQGGLFGSSSASQGGQFGSGVSTSSQGTLFGSSTTALFGTATSPSAPGFGSAATTTNQGVFGSQVVSSSSGFGQSAFGQTSVANSKSPAFGQSAFSKPPVSQTSGGIGVGFGDLGLGGQPNQADRNPFSTPAPTQSSSSGTSLFGGSPSNAFKPTFDSGSPGFNSQSSGFGGSFSKGTGNVASSGFAVSSMGSSSPSGFGSAPAFGNTPAFGSSPAFGAAPAFGATPSFGSSPQIGASPTGSVFGSGGGGFGSSQGGSTFGALAQQSTGLSFGSVAQQSSGFGSFAGQQQQTQTAFGGFSGNSSPAFGGGGSSGSSFNQWR